VYLSLKLIFDFFKYFQILQLCTKMRLTLENHLKHCYLSLDWTEMTSLSLANSVKYS